MARLRDGRWAQWEPAGPRSGLARWVPAAFVLFSLFALLVAPLVLSGRIQSIRETLVEPGDDAREEINIVRHAITRGEAAIRGLLLTGDPRFVEALQAARSEELAAFERLILVANRLDPELARSVRQLEDRSERSFQARVALFEELEAGNLAPDLLAREEERHERLMRESEAVKTAIVATTDTARAAIRQLRDVEMALTLLLVLLALLSALVVLGISRTQRLRAQSESELRAAAFSVAEPTEVNEVLRRIARMAARPRRGESSFVERLDPELGELEVVAVAGQGAPPLGTRLPYAGSLTEEAVTAGQQDFVADMTRPERPMSRTLLESCGRCVALVIPLVGNGDPEGSLVILRPHGSRFTESDIQQRRALGTLAALALRKTVLIEQAQKQHQELEQATRTRERLVRGFSHDVKNPLGAADGHAQLLADGVLGELEPRQRESVLRIRSGIRSALELIGNLIELAKKETGQIRVTAEPVDVAAVVEETADVYRAAADARGLQLETATDEQLPPVISDARRIRQVLGNLLSNAIKYTPRGGAIQIDAALRTGRRALDPSGWVTLSVSDTGEGVAPEEQVRMFAEFQRLEPETSPGEGLGLASSQRVANSLGGEISVESEPGQGSTFTLWLPLRNGTGTDG